MAESPGIILNNSKKQLISAGIIAHGNGFIVSEQIRSKIMRKHILSMVLYFSLSFLTLYSSSTVGLRTVILITLNDCYDYDD